MLRVMDRSKRGQVQVKAMLVTFVASSVWHGTYPGFYIFFIWCAASEILCKNFSKVIIVDKVR